MLRLIRKGCLLILLITSSLLAIGAVRLHSRSETLRETYAFELGNYQYMALSMKGGLELSVTDQINGYTNGYTVWEADQYLRLGMEYSLPRPRVSRWSVFTYRVQVHPGNLFAKARHTYSLEFPIWVLTLPFPLLLLSLLLLSARDRFRRPKPGTCQKCGYDLRATPERCPECGQVVENCKSEDPKMDSTSDASSAG